MPTDSALLTAMEDTYREVFRQAVHLPGFDLLTTPGLTRVRSTLPSPWFNAVLSSRLEPHQHADAVAALVDEHRTRGTPLLWRLGPATTHREALGQALHQAGFRPAPQSTAILGDIPRVIDLWAMLPLPVRGVRVADEAGYRDWFGVFSATFGVPVGLEPLFTEAAGVGGFAESAPTQHLALEARGRPVACCTTVWQPGQPFASVFNFAVAPDARRSGIGKYLLAFAAYRLRQQSCPAIGQFSTPEGAPFYLRVAPSRRLGTFHNWIWMGG
jgi:ribosomal protein S18 acetylase RimI-like enzyme